MSNTHKRIVKKYPNRRLYDTGVSKYITLDDIKTLVLEGINFRVIDARSEQDLTHDVLLQIITEQEQEYDPIFSTNTLTQLIRSYGNSYQQRLSEFLQNSLELFAQQQNELQKEVQSNRDELDLKL